MHAKVRCPTTRLSVSDVIRKRDKSDDKLVHRLCQRLRKALPICFTAFLGAELILVALEFPAVLAGLLRLPTVAATVKVVSGSLHPWEVSSQRGQYEGGGSEKKFSFHLTLLYFFRDADLWRDWASGEIFIRQRRHQGKSLMAASMPK